MVKKGDIIPGIFSLLVGALILVYIALKPKMAIGGEMVNGGIGPGAFPAICGVALIICGILLFVRGIKQNGTVDYFAFTPERKENMKIAALLVLMCALMMAAWKISRMFLVCLPVYAFAVNKLLKRTTKFSIIFTIVITAFVYVLFGLCFNVSFRP